MIKKEERGRQAEYELRVRECARRVYRGRPNKQSGALVERALWLNANDDDDR